MKRLRLGQRVKLINPVSISARFYSPDHGGIVGAGNIVLERNLLDGPAFVVSIANGSKAQRGLIAFGSPESNLGMWINVESLEKNEESKS